MKAPAIDTVALYIRTSKDDSDPEKQSIKQQEKLGKEWAKTNFPKSKMDVFSDPDISAFNDELQTRQGMMDLMREVKAGRVAYVWCWELSRLARNSMASAIIFSELKKAGTKLYINGAHYDMDKPTDKFFIELLSLFAEYERSLIVSRTKRGQLESREEGMRVGRGLYGYKKTGYKKVGRKKQVIWEVDPKEKAHVQLIFETMIQLGSLRSMIMRLENITNHDEIWHRANWYTRIIKHIEYTGKTQKPSNKKFIPCLNYPDAFISMETWEKANSLLKKNQKIRDRDDSYLLSGILSCSKCGKPFYHFLDKTSGIDYYKHSSDCKCGIRPNHIPMIIDDAVELAFRNNYSHIDVMNGYFVERSKKMDDLKISIENMNKELTLELKRINQKIDNLLDEMEDKHDPDLKARLRKRQEERNKIEENINTNAKSLITSEVDDFTLSEDEMLNLLDKYDNADMAEKRQILSQNCKIHQTEKGVLIGWAWGISHVIVIPAKGEKLFTVHTINPEPEYYETVVRNRDKVLSQVFLIEQ